LSPGATTENGGEADHSYVVGGTQRRRQDNSMCISLPTLPQGRDST